MVRIPQEYQEVEYLESTGTQWIDTGTTINNGCVISIDFYIADTAANRVIWGYRRDRTYQYPYQAYFGANGSKIRYIAFGIDAKAISVVNNVFNYDTINNIVIDTNNKVILINGEAKNCNGRFVNGYAFDSDGSSEYHPYLFALNAMGSELAISSDTKIYGYSVSYDGSLLQNFIPCYRKSDNEAGMYDTVSGTFYTNNGTGTFLVGNPVDYSTISLLEARRRILLNTPHLESLSGATVSFETDMTSNLKECKIHFTPIQDGWDGVTVYKTGKNLLVKEEITFTTGKYIKTDGTIGDSSYYKLSNVILCKHLAGKTITTNALVNAGGTSVKSLAFYLSDEVSSDTCVLAVHKATASVEHITFNVPSTAKYMLICLNKATTLDDKYIVEGTEPLNEVDAPTAITISFPHTIYGGYVDLVMGEVVEEIDSEGQQITPNTYSITPQTIRTLRGMNNIWSDANGNIEIKYWTH